MTTTRTHYQAGSPYFSGVCHVMQSYSTNVNYVFTNGTTLVNAPPANPSENGVAPSACQVSHKALGMGSSGRQ